MGKTTEISWCDSTFNPWIGCTKVSPACTNCYAETLMHRWGKDLWGKGQPRQRTSAANWKQPLAWEKQAAATGIRRKVFCGSLCDWLDAEVPIEWLADLLDLIRQTPNLDWLLLTKRPELWGERICGATGYWGYEGQIGHCGATDAWAFGFDWLHFRFPANVWIGATVENQEMADKRIPELLKIPAVKHFVSIEPQLGAVNMRTVACIRAGGQTIIDALTGHMPNAFSGTKPSWTRIDWVICGGESGPKARPMHPDWARSLRDQCKAAGVAYFFKQWGEWLPCLGVLQEEPYKNHYEQASDGKMLMVKGNRPEPARRVLDEKVVAFRVGKARAGHLLDGVEHHEFPCVESEASHE
jgi:protein gp37